MFLALAEMLVQTFILMDDWHKSLLDSKCDNLDLICATIVQRHQSGLFHYAFRPCFRTGGGSILCLC